MKFENILVPYDRSESAKRALTTALAMAADTPGARVTAFFAAPVPEFESSQFLAAESVSGIMHMPADELGAMQRQYIAYEQGLLAEDLQDYVGDSLFAPQGPLAVAVGQGKPSKAILDYALDHNNDLIVMGCRGLNAVAGMLGSVSYAVLRNASCPVLIEK
ncbi:MAG: universal stress protein [Slackia sp.]|nr:universal stress protein [Slackia sp.]